MPSGRKVTTQKKKEERRKQEINVLPSMAKDRACTMSPLETISDVTAWFIILTDFLTVYSIISHKKIKIRNMIDRYDATSIAQGLQSVMDNIRCA